MPEGSAYPYWKPVATTYCNDSQCPGLEVLEVEKGKTYRLRLGNIADLAFMNIAVQGHNLTVVEADGRLAEPMTVQSLDLNAGQRYSVLFTANQEVGAYWINVITRHRTGVVAGQAILKYQGATGEKPNVTVDVVMATQPKRDDVNFTFAQQNALRGKTSAPENDKVKRRIVMLVTQEQFDLSGGSTSHDPKSRPEDNCNYTGTYGRYAVNRMSYQWENTPVLHMVYYGVRPETLTEDRGYYKIKGGDVIDIVVQNYPTCFQVRDRFAY